MIKVLMIGDNEFPYHRLSEKKDIIASILELPSLEFETTTTKEALKYENLKEYDVLIDYLTDSRMSEAEYSGLQSFINTGGGYVGLHCAANLTLTTAGRLDEPIPEMVDLIGGYFVDHPESSHFEVSVTDTTHPVTDDLSDFTVFDEPYHVRYNDVQVLARMNHPQLQNTPVLWTKHSGDGRICYCSLGHTNETFYTKGFKKILINSVQWVGQFDRSFV